MAKANLVRHRSETEHLTPSLIERISRKKARDLACGDYRVRALLTAAVKYERLGKIAASVTTNLEAHTVELALREAAEKLIVQLAAGKVEIERTPANVLYWDGKEL